MLQLGCLLFECLDLKIISVYQCLSLLILLFLPTFPTSRLPHLPSTPYRALPMATAGLRSLPVVAPRPQGARAARHGDLLGEAAGWRADEAWGAGRAAREPFRGWAKGYAKALRMSKPYGTHWLELQQISTNSWLFRNSGGVPCLLKVYDARSRHVHLETPQSLFSDTSVKVKREDLVQRAFALHGLLSSEEDWCPESRSWFYQKHPTTNILVRSCHILFAWAMWPYL